MSWLFQDLLKVMEDTILTNVNWYQKLTRKDDDDDQRMKSQYF